MYIGPCAVMVGHVRRDGASSTVGFETCRYSVEGTEPGRCHTPLKSLLEPDFLKPC